MEYPGRDDRNWEITVFDTNGKPMYHEKNLTQAEADSLADRWLIKPGVGAVKGNPT